MYNTQNYWVFGLFPLSSILETRKHNISESGPVSILWWGGTATQLGPLERVKLFLRDRWVIFKLVNQQNHQETGSPHISL
jgi:hypothetical protein